MSPEMESIRQMLEKEIESFHYVRAQEIPAIDLYMDQVTTFMEDRLRQTARHPETDKILTKTMINNYAKSDLLIPPVKKKYNMDHMLLLLFIYYFKSFLSIGDIQQILRPIREKYAEDPRKNTRVPQREREDGESLETIYNAVLEQIEGQMERIAQETERQIQEADASFADAPEQDRAMLQRFDLICQMSAEVFVKKMLIERMIDQFDQTEPK
ncbi:MAG: DUF1836 domain-containing protein [Eubacteriales bacterium]|nr:DUF1836 domain-containing protein [Eubacteriales bacterium]